MAADPAVPGMFTTEVKLLSKGVSLFQIIRNHDFDQAIYPEEPGADSTSVVLGPDMQMGTSWALEGRQGDIFQVNYQRESESQKVTWSFLRNEELTRTEHAEAKRPLFFAVGTWDDGMGVHRMNWTGEYFQFYVQLGSRAKESFQIYMNGNRSKCIYPGTADANPFEKHELKGPDRLSAGFMWTIGANESDEADAGARYEIRLRVSDDDFSPEKLDWKPVRGTEGLEEAKGRGFLVSGM